MQLPKVGVGIAVVQVQVYPDRPYITAEEIVTDRVGPASRKRNPPGDRPDYGRDAAYAR